MYCYLKNPFKTIYKVRKVFKFPKFRFKCCINPICRPFIWCNPNKIMFVSKDLGWKDKYDTPRYEEPPYVWIKIYKFELILWFEEDPDYWEQILWYLYYYGNDTQYRNSKPDIKVAKNSWPWETTNGISTWNDKYLRK